MKNKNLIAACTAQTTKIKYDKFHKLNKFKSKFLALALFFGLTQAQLNAQIVDSGSCGMYLTWTLTADGTLTIDGTGDMDNYSPALWSSYITVINSVVIGNAVTSIGSNAFAGCGKLTSVTIPNSILSIGEHAFHDCSGLTSLTIGNSVVSIGDWVFAGCSKLTSVTIPNSVTSFGKGIFHSCSGLISVIIPNSVTSIGEEAFVGCSNLTSVTIPNSVTSIGRWAFENCSGLTSISIPNAVTVIEAGSFRGCSGLTFIIISNAVTEIQNSAFADCTGLTEITSYAVQPPEAHYFAFFNVPTDIISVHVPCASVVAYQNAIMWFEFTNYGECISTVPETGVVIDGITWATCNVDAPGTFAASPESYGMFYQWNRKAGHPATGEASNWDSSTPEGAEWETVNDPCPAGWRVPTNYELASLAMNAGSTWTTQNGVNGRLFGVAPNTIFLPAAGFIDWNSGSVGGIGQDGSYWSSTQFPFSSDEAYNLGFESDIVVTYHLVQRSYGASVRCVACGDGTAVEQVKTDNLRIYVSHENLIIENALPNENVRIFNIAGQNVFNFQFSTFSSINVSSLSAGVYIVKVRDKTAKFVKR